MSDRRTSEGLLSNWKGPDETPESPAHLEPKYCSTCGVQIPPERLEAVPHTTTCVACSREPARIGYLIFAHKTGGEFCMVDPRDTESMRRAQRANRRHR